MLYQTISILKLTVIEWTAGQILRWPRLSGVLQVQVVSSNDTRHCRNLQTLSFRTSRSRSIDRSQSRERLMRSLFARISLSRLSPILPVPRGCLLVEYWREHRYRLEQRVSVCHSVLALGRRNYLCEFNFHYKARCLPVIGWAKKCRVHRI